MHQSYLRANANTSLLGCSTGRQLSRWLAQAYLQVPEVHLGARHQAVNEALARIDRASGADLDTALKAFRREEVYRVHGTNLVKCHTVERESEYDDRFRELAAVCTKRHLRGEILRLRPRIVLLLGQPVVDGFKAAFGLRLHWPPILEPVSVAVDDFRFEALVFYHPMYGGRNTRAFAPVLARFTSKLAQLIAAN